MEYKKYISMQRAKWIGVKVIYEVDNNVYTVVDVDYNGLLLIDKPTRFNETTAVSPLSVKVKFQYEWSEGYEDK